MAVCAPPQGEEDEVDSKGLPATGGSTSTQAKDAQTSKETSLAEKWEVIGKVVEYEELLTEALLAGRSRLGPEGRARVSRA